MGEAPNSRPSSGGLTLRKKVMREFTLKEVEEHCEESRRLKEAVCWVVLDSKVYDMTKFVNYHPGGSHVLRSKSGRDCTDSFDVFHPSWVKEKKLPHYQIGVIVDENVSPLTKDFRELKQRVIKEGLYETNYWWFAFVILRVFSIFAASVYCVVSWDSIYIHALGGILMALFFQQLAFIGHDTGHNGITHNRTIDSMFGIFVGNVMTGIGMGWWKHNHNFHHVVPNSLDYDPDIQHMPVFAINPRFLDNLWSYYYEKIMVFDAVAQWALQYQHFLFYPVMAIARFNLYVQSWCLLLFRPRIEHRKLEMVGLILFYIWFGVLLSYLPTPAERGMFLALSHCLAGILHVQICLSHFSMGTYEGPTYDAKSGEENFFRQQIITSLDIKSNCFNNWFYGGLQWQVVHHLFPRVPRHNLPRLQLLVKDLAAKHNIHYHEVGFWEANWEIVRTLSRTAEAVRSGKRANFGNSALYQLLNAQG
eukprot:Rmarinus@m.19750